MRLIVILSPTDKGGYKNRIYQIGKISSEGWIYSYCSGSIYASGAE